MVRKESEASDAPLITAGLSRKAKLVLKTAKALTPALLVNRGDEIARLYKDPTLTMPQIAKRVIPETHALFPSAATVAVRNVARELIPQEERLRLVLERQALHAKRKMKALPKEELRAHQIAAAKASQQKHPKNMDELIRARGQTPWTNHEKQFAFSLIIQSSYHERKGDQDIPHYSKIADAINNAFHGGKTVRNKDSIRGFLRSGKS